MRVAIMGVDGYLGWSLAQYLASYGHVIGGMDAYLRRDWVAEVGSHSATPIAKMTERLDAFYQVFGKSLRFVRGDITEYEKVKEFLRGFKPDCIVHLAEMPSAPYSMISANHCTWTHANNLAGTINLLYIMKEEFPECHLLKLGTMGEYGTPNVAIPEGFFDIAYRGRTDTLPFPRQPGSWYHCTKVHDSVNIHLACKLWGLRSTDIMQGVVYGVTLPEMLTDPRLLTRFDFDEAFGTAINRFVAQALVGVPLTPYGKGRQARGFLPLCDSMQCFRLAIENPPEQGEYRVLNQFEDVYFLDELANMVAHEANEVGYSDIKAEVANIENPRLEAEEHYYNPDRKKLLDLGYKPNGDIRGTIRSMLCTVAEYMYRINSHKHVLIPKIRWDGTKDTCQRL